MKTVILYLVTIFIQAVLAKEISRIDVTVIREDTNDICPSKTKREDSLQLLKSNVSAILASYYIEGPSSPTLPSVTMSPTAMLVQSTSFGGTGGTFFDDYNDNIAGIIGMSIRAGDQIDSIQVTYRLKDGNIYEAPMHGGTGGSESSFTLSAGEKLVRMVGMTNGILIDQLTFYSNNNNVYGPYGVTGQIPFSVEGTEIVAFFGRVGNLLDAIGVYYTG